MKYSPKKSSSKDKKSRYESFLILRKIGLTNLINNIKDNLI